MKFILLAAAFFSSVLCFDNFDGVRLISYENNLDSDGSISAFNVAI